MDDTINTSGTIDNNLGPDRFAGPILLLHDLCLEVLTVHVNELHLFRARELPLLLLLMSRI